MSASLTLEETQALTHVEFHEKFAFLFQPHAYKIAWGGRNALKSWSYARALLVLGSRQPERILCTREVQKSLKDSVHQLLCDQITELGLEDFYEPYESEIRGRNGTTFLFAGLSEQTSRTIKSFEGVNKCWIEEAQTITKRSYEILIPTIRKEGSELWVSFNPELDTDETYVRFILEPPEDTVSVFTTFKDNPWFSAKSEKDRRHCELTDPEGYQNIWLGVPRSAVAGAIYAKEVTLAYKERRICCVPYDPALKVHTVWDLGHRDYTAIGLFQKGYAEYRMIGMIYDHQRKLHEYAAELNGLHLNWGWDWLPHDGFIEDVKSPSAYHILVQHGRRVKPKVGTKLPIPNVDVEIGIKALRGIFHRLVIDAETCAVFIEAAKRYRRVINQQTQQPGPPLHDIHSDPMDMGRYFALIADKMTNDEERELRPKGRVQPPFDAGTGAL